MSCRSASARTSTTAHALLNRRVVLGNVPGSAGLGNRSKIEARRAALPTPSSTARRVVSPLFLQAFDAMDMTGHCFVVHLTGGTPADGEAKNPFEVVATWIFLP